VPVEASVPELPPAEASIPEPAPVEAMSAEPADPPMSAPESPSGGEPAEAPPVEHLVFRVGRELFALPLDTVEEVLDVDRVQRIPEMGPTMLGVMALRGAMVPLYSPGVPLGVAAEGTRAALIFVTARGRVALAVDDVDDVLVISADDVRRPPLDFGDGVLVGVARRGTDLIGVLSADALVTACRAEPVLETS
jgi:purine-binding chemotaxis protein CheW